MTPYFVDTSALLKRYVLEEGSAVIDDLIRDAGALHISQVAAVELLSSLKRLEAVDRVLAPDLYADLVQAFWSDVEVGALSVLEVTSEAVRRAGELLEERYLSPIDALQVAMATSLQPDRGSVIFVSSDAKLNTVVRSLGLDVLDPAAPETPLQSRQRP